MGGGGCCIANCCILDLPCFFDRGGDGCGYHPGPSETDEHAKKIADELAEMKEKIRKSTENTEKELIEYINRSMNSLIKELQDINNQAYGGKTLNININGIKQKNEELKKEVVGHIGNIMDGRLVLKDKELSVILEERDDKKRAKNFDSFCVKIQRQALLSLKAKIESTVKKQEEMVRREIQTRLDEVDRSMKEALNAYTEILHVKETDGANMEEMQMKYIYKYGLCDILLEQLES